MAQTSAVAEASGVEIGTHHHTAALLDMAGVTRTQELDNRRAARPNSHCEATAQVVANSPQPKNAKRSASTNIRPMNSIYFHPEPADRAERMSISELSAPSKEPRP